MERSSRGDGDDKAVVPASKPGPGDFKASGIYELPVFAPEPRSARATPAAGSVVLEGPVQLVEPLSEEAAPPAAEISTEIEAARQLIAELGAAKTALAQPDASPRAPAQEVLNRARALVDALAQAEGAAAEATRSALLDAYFGLERSLERMENIQHVQERVRRPTAQPRAAEVARAERPLAREGRRQLRLPLLILLIITLLGGGLSIVVWLMRPNPDEAEPAVEQLAQQGAVIAQLRHAGRLTQQLRNGIPVVTYVKLSRDRQGGLRAIAVAITIKGKALKRTYTWYKNGEILRAGEETGVMTAQDLAPPGSYKVAATARDGASVSAPLVTGELTL